MNILRLAAPEVATAKSVYNLLKNNGLFCGENLQQLFRRKLHANRASISRIKRSQFEYCRQYPVQIVFQDGSTILARHPVPREIIKLPSLLEDCRTNLQTKQWLSRRKPKDIIHVEKDDTAVSFNQMDYLKTLKRGVGGSDKSSSKKITKK